MAKLTYTTDELLDRVRKKGGWTASGQIGATDTDVIRAMNEALYTEILPRLMKVKEEFFVLTRRVPLTANEHRYRIPKRAAGQKLRDLYWIDSAGDRHRIPHIARERRDLYDDSANEPEAYYLEGTYIVLVPDLQGASGFLELAYFFRPGQLVKVSETRTIISMTTVGANRQLGVQGGLPSSWQTGLRFDIHSPDSGAQPKAFDVLCTDANGASNYVAFALTSVDGSEYGADAVESGDYICLAGEAAVPGVPLELHPVLIQATVARMAEGLGDETYQYHRAELDRMLQAAGYLYDTRVEGQPKKFSSRQGAILYGGGGRRRWSW